MAKLKTLLDQHHQFKSPNSLNYVFGDGYLLAHNSIYRDVRNFIVAEKIQFTQDMPNDFAALPLGQLEFLLAEKKIFYFNNVSVLEKIESKVPQQISWDSVSGHLKRNMIFHESCHFLIRTEIQDTGLSHSKKSVVQVLVEESFANACEFLAIKDANDQIHKSFYEFNSYIYHPEMKSIIEDLCDQIGFEKLFQWIVICFLFSNYLFDSIPDKDLSGVFDLIEVAKPVHPLLLKQLKHIGRRAFELNPDFKLATTDFHLIYNGLSKGLAGLQNVNPLQKLEEEPAYFQAISKLSKYLNSN